MGRLDEATDYYPEGPRDRPQLRPGPQQPRPGLERPRANGLKRFTTSGRPSGSAPSWPRLTTTSARSGLTRVGWTRRSPTTGRRCGSTPSSPGPSTCSASRWPAGAGWTRRTTAISGPVHDDPDGAEAHKKTRGRGGRQGDHPLPADPRDRPDSSRLSRNSLGLTPRDADRLNEAIGHYETAVRIEPGLFMAHAALGQALLALGRFREAEAATRRCLDRLPQGHELRSNVLAQLRRCERLIALQDRLPAVLEGKDKPADAAETLEFAELCGLQGQMVAAARLYAEALDASPRLAGDLHAEHRYRAACAATLVGCGRGANAAGLSEAERARWRQRAREWLRAEVTLWTSVLDGGPHADRFLVAQKLARLWADPQLDGLLDHEAMDRLPQAERQECRALRDAIDILIRRAETIN